MLLVAALLWADSALAAGAADNALTLLWLAVLLLLARASSVIERFGQPAVLGELLVGIVLGNLVLLGVDLFEPVKHDVFIQFLSELGVVILLFQVGLESDVQAMRRVGLRAFLVACVGVAAPFALGTLVVGPTLFPGAGFNVYLFLGATLTATSVGITARVFKDMGTLRSTEAQIILGAAVIDDVIGLIILAVISAVVTVGTIDPGTIAWITLKALLFLFGALMLGQRFAPMISRGFARIHSGVGMKVTVALGLCFMCAYLAQAIGLAPIVGAFAAGLVLDEVTFQDYEDPDVIADVRTALGDAEAAVAGRVEDVLKHHRASHLESLIAPIGHLLVPVFFVYTGTQVNLATLFDVSALLVALAMTALAFIGKLVSGLVAGPVNKWIVGWGMAPRGEVGLIFAVVGKQLGVVDDQVFSIIVIMVMLTTLLTPPVLAFLLRRNLHESAWDGTAPGGKVL